MIHAHVEAERNTRNVMVQTYKGGVYMESIYLDRDKISLIKSMVEELGVSL